MGFGYDYVLVFLGYCPGLLTRFLAAYGRNWQMTAWLTPARLDLLKSHFSVTTHCPGFGALTIDPCLWIFMSVFPTLAPGFVLDLVEPLSIRRSKGFC